MEQRRVKNPYRRNLLKYALFGGGVLVLGKLAHSLVTFWGREKIIGTKEFDNFTLEETNKELRLLDNSGEEIVIFEKE